MAAACGLAAQQIDDDLIDNDISLLRERMIFLVRIRPDLAASD